MWYPTMVTVPPVAEPVTLDDVKKQLRVYDFTDDDDFLTTVLIPSARDYVEKYCNTRFATQTVEMKCDSFDDLAELSEAPVQSVTSISYIASDGTVTMLPDTVYELRADGLVASVNLQYAQQWPVIQVGSRITVTAVVGYDVAPPTVGQAMLILITTDYDNRQNTLLNDGGRTVPPGATWLAGWTHVDSLLANYRRF